MFQHLARWRAYSPRWKSLGKEQGWEAESRARTGHAKFKSLYIHMPTFEIAHIGHMSARKWLIQKFGAKEEVKGYKYKQGKNA